MLVLMKYVRPEPSTRLTEPVPAVAMEHQVVRATTKTVRKFILPMTSVPADQ